MAKKLTAKEMDEQLGTDAVRLEATSTGPKTAAGKPAKKVVGRKTAEALVRTKKWRVVDERYSARAAAAGSGGPPTSASGSGTGS